jgi:signal peptidase I
MGNIKRRIARHFPSGLFGKRPAWTVARLILFLALLFILSNYIFKLTIVTGTSMAPTFEDGDIILVNRLAFREREPERGEVVLIELEDEWLVKRVVGLPGETVSIIKGVVLIDGQPLPEPYVKQSVPWIYLPEQLGPAEYLVIGDNRAVEQVFGKASREQIIGRVLFTE